MNGKNSDRVPIIFGWWIQLRDQRGAVAKLRRTESLMAAIMEPATMRLAHQLGASPAELEDVALHAVVLAEVRANMPGLSVARTLGSPGEKPIYSPNRLQRLIEAPKGMAQVTAFRRALAILDHSANVRDLAHSLLDWNSPARSDRRRQQWLYDYYQTENPAQGQAQEINA